MIRRTLGLLAFGAGIILVACSSDAAADPYPSADSFCDAKATAECKTSAAICGVTAAICQSSRKTACLGDSSTATGQGRVYTSANAQDCIDKTTAVYADKVVDPTKETAFKTSCAKVFAGAKTVNEACTTLYECAGALLCDLDKGVCANQTITKVQGGCNNPGDVCDVGLYCQAQGANKFCVAKNALNAVCHTPDAPCLEDLRCNGSNCVAKAASGEACDTDDECTTNHCDQTTTPKKCVAEVFPSENGTCKDFGGG